MNGTFAYNGVVYDAVSGLEIGRVPSARLGVRAWVAEEAAQPGVKVTPIRFKVEPPRLAKAVVDPDETDDQRRERLSARRPLTGLQRLAHHETVLQHWALVGSMSLDPDDASAAEPEGIVYETTPDTAMARIDGFVWLRLDAQGEVEFASLECQAKPVCKLRIAHRRTFAPDVSLVEVSPQDGRDPDTWLPHSPMVEAGVVEDEKLIMSWIHRDDAEVNKARRARLEETGDTSREWIRGAAAPKDLTMFDYERLLSNPDVPVKARRDGKKLLPFVVQERAFPGEQNLGLVLKQRLASGDKVVSERMLAAWSASMRSRFNVRRYVEAIASAFGDDPREVFAVIDEGRRTKSTSWAKVESFVARQYEAFAEDCYLSGVSDGVHGEWLQMGDADQAAEWSQILNDEGFGTEYADIGHSLYQTRLVTTRRPRLSGNPETAAVLVKDRTTGEILDVDPKTYGRSMPIRVRPTRPSERGVFTMKEVVDGLLSTVRRMSPTYPGPSQAWHDAMTTAWWWDQPESHEGEGWQD